MGAEIYRVFVDETGDRGWSTTASPVFVLSAVVIRDEDMPVVMAGLDQINTALNKPSGTTLHWAENIKKHDQRKYVANLLASLPFEIVHVVTVKTPMLGTERKISDATSMYNYAVRRLLERLTWCVDDHSGEAIVTFAHVRNFPYEHLRSYVQLLKAGPSTIRWRALHGSARIDQPSRVRGLQLADLCAGTVSAALRSDQFGAYEHSYLTTLIPRFYIRDGGSVTSYGWNVVGPSDYMRTYPWWADFLDRCGSRDDAE